MRLLVPIVLNEYGLRVRVRSTGEDFYLGTGTEKSTVFFKFRMTEYGWILVFKVRTNYVLKTVDKLVRGTERSTGNF